MFPLLLAISVWFGSYSVLDSGSKAVPYLSNRQVAWLDAIRCTPAYLKRWTNLRFLLEPITGYSQTVPLVVFDTNGWTPAFHGCCAYFHIIGESCRTDFDLETHAIVGVPTEICQPGAGPNMSATPAPVLGQTWFAEHQWGVPSERGCTRRTPARPKHS
jgi:hypothetical protein